MEFPRFDGGWSYTQREMEALFKHIKYKSPYRILEFGGGSSSLKLYTFFKTKVEELHYTIYETNSSYIESMKSFATIVLYNHSSIQTLTLEPIQYDLILIDGPNGEDRQYWYSKLRNNTKPGTILLVDDFNHFAAFSEQLDANFEYEVLEHHEETPVAWGEHSWKIVKIIQPRF